jgi:hypothetical protein
MKQILFIFAVFSITGFSFNSRAFADQADLPSVKVSNIRRVFHNGEHNAFTDLIRFKDQFFLTFRSCPDGHGVNDSASIIVLSSSDSKRWNQIHQFSVPNRDTRDPHFLVFKERLFIYTGTWYDDPSGQFDLNQHLGYGVWSEDGIHWATPTVLEGTFGHYVWKAATFGNKAYLCGRRKANFAVGPKGEGKAVESAMLVSDDGITWKHHSLFQEVSGDETVFLFEPDGAIIAIGRRGSQAAQLCLTSPPYTEWQRSDLDRYIGGPLLTRWGPHLVVGGRKFTENRGAKTSMCWFKDEQLIEFAELPSGGDNSYPGFVALSDKRALMSWYSSHEKTQDGKTITAIYLADLSVK